VCALRPIPQRSAATFFAEGNDPKAFKARSRTADPLREWLQHLSFTIPTLEMNASGFELTISEFSCSDVAILDVKSSYASLSLKADLDGVGVGCKLNVHYRQIAWPHLLTGNVGAALNVSNAGVHAALSGVCGTALQTGVRCCNTLCRRALRRWHAVVDIGR
jgi:hypothetical protein